MNSAIFVPPVMRGIGRRLSLGASPLRLGPGVCAPPVAGVAEECWAKAQWRRPFGSAAPNTEEKALLPLPVPVEPIRKLQTTDATPKEMVEYLDNYIIGQKEAKRAVANAMRNRWRRKKLSDEFQEHVTPKNILLVGATGCGKTEIARRLAKFIKAPFVRVEATKFTEVGYHGRDVDTIIRDLVEVALKLERKKLEDEYRPLAMECVEKRIIEALLGKMANDMDYSTWLKHLRAGWLEDRMVSVDVPPTERMGADPLFDGSVRLMVQPSSRESKLETMKLKISDARKRLLEMELDARIALDDIQRRAIDCVEQEGVVFIDEIDKIVSKQGHGWGSDASAEGVQRDLLPLIEGCSINTKYGKIVTDFILFVCAGSFHAVKPSDMIAELQGRLPVRVELQALTKNDFVRVLTEPEFNLLVQQKELLKTENVNLEFTEDCIEEIATLSEEINFTVENIGARRLHTVVEKIIDSISFDAPQRSDTSPIIIDKAYVRSQVEGLLKEGKFRADCV